MSGETEETAPVLRVVHGSPTDEELAAVIAVLLARAGASSDAPGPVRPSNAPSPWAAHWRRTSALPRPGAGAWRASVR